MRVFMLDAAAGEEIVRRDQGLDDSFIGVALLA